MAISLYCFSPIGSSFDERLSRALAAPQAGPWWDWTVDGDFTDASALFSAPFTFRAPYAIWKNSVGLLQYTAPAPAGEPTFLFDPSKSCRRARFDFPTRTLADINIISADPAINASCFLGGCDPSVGRTFDLPASESYDAIAGLYAFQLPAFFLKAHANQPVLI